MLSHDEFIKGLEEYKKQSDLFPHPDTAVPDNLARPTKKAKLITRKKEETTRSFGNQHIRN